MNGNHQSSVPSLTSKESSGLELSHDNFHDLLDEALYESDDFRMYGYKVTRCPRRYRHDWMLCPSAHFGEKARRRYPRLYNYVGIQGRDVYERRFLCLRTWRFRALAPSWQVPYSYVQFTCFLCVEGVLLCTLCKNSNQKLVARGARFEHS